MPPDAMVRMLSPSTSSVPKAALKSATVYPAPRTAGFGSPALKIGVFHRLAFPDPPYGIGFKLFLHQDANLMSPAQVMALDPRPDVITYE